MERKVSVPLGDSLQGIERPVVEETEGANALFQALGRERRAEYQLIAAVDSRSRALKGAAATAETDNVRRARVPCAVGAEPHRGRRGDPALPDPARLTIDVGLDAILVNVRVGRGAPNYDGIRAETVAAVTHACATVGLNRLEQDLLCVRRPRS